MPHLEVTYFLNQIFWCIFTYLLIYMTAGRTFFSNYSNILIQRKEMLQHYVNKTKEMINESKIIEKKILELDKMVIDEVRIREIELRKNISNINNERLGILKEEIKQKNLAHRIYLGQLKESLIKDLKKYMPEITGHIKSLLNNE